MLTDKESQELMNKFVELRKKSKSGEREDIEKFKQHEALCVEKFKYIVHMRTSKYRQFINYDDLNQDGIEVLVRAMRNYNPKKGSFFWWSHRYIDTRIARRANLHTAVRYPMTYAKKNPPHKELKFPLLLDYKDPEIILEEVQTSEIVAKAIAILSKNQQQIVKMAFGFGGSKPLSVSKICKKLKMNRNYCVSILNDALNELKVNIDMEKFE